jgi:hypothetical protein
MFLYFIFYFSGPAESTHLNQSLEQRHDYGVFNISVITAASSTSNCLNTTYTTPADTTEDTAPADTTEDTAPADTTADLPAALTHAELTASFDVTRRDIQDPPEILEE